MFRGRMKGQCLIQIGEINERSFRGGGAIKTIHFGHGGQVKTLMDVPDGVASLLEGGALGSEARVLRDRVLEPLRRRARPPPLLPIQIRPSASAATARTACGVIEAGSAGS